jgi:hypothetical protein
MFSAMQYDRLIERTLRDAQGVLRANFPPAKNLSDNQAVQSLRALFVRHKSEKCWSGAKTPLAMASNFTTGT